jgi:hypothetical protein
VHLARDGSAGHTQAVNPRYLVDAIVRQTTVLIAQLSTAAGIRAPLAHVAEQVFRDLAHELETQGVGRKVVADMFGMALRSYQMKLQRLEESVTQHDRTLWQAVFDYVTETGAPTRSDIVLRFEGDDERAVGAVLRDLETSGLVYRSGRGQLAIYRATSDADRQALGASADLESLKNLVWVHIYRSGRTDLDGLLALWPSAATLLPEALRRLEAEARIVAESVEDGCVHYRANEIAIPVGSELGWEGAVLDHYRAMATAIGSKLVVMSERPELGEQVGGATLTFDLYDGHPQEREVRDLLVQTRRQVNALWDQVKETNRVAEPSARKRFRVTFYFGQNVEEIAHG